jgi:hypothetical protein
MSQGIESEFATIQDLRDESQKKITATSGQIMQHSAKCPDGLGAYLPIAT